MRVVKTLFLIAFGPIGGLAILLLLRSDLFFAPGAQVQDSVWQFLGAALSYVGVVFSAYAVVEVRRLTRRFVDRQLLPGLQKQIEEILKEMTAVSGGKLATLKSERLLGRISVILSQLSKAESSEVSDLAKKAMAKKTTIDQRVAAAGDATTINDVSEYWSLFQYLSQLADQIDADDRERGASL